MGIYKRLDIWMERYLAKRKISTKPSTSRWGITQIVLGFSLFLVAVSIAFISLWLALWSIEMIIAGWFALCFAIVAFGTGIFMFCHMIHWGGKWLQDQEPSAEWKAIKSLTAITIVIARKLGITDEELNDIQNEGEGDERTKEE